MTPAPSPSATRPRAPVSSTPPRSAPLPRPAPTDATGSQRPSRGPSSTRLERQPLAPSAARGTERKSETPSSGSRPIDREKILERYQRPDARTRDDGAAEADSVRKAREGYRAEQDAKLSERRQNAEESRAKADAEADRVKDARDVYRAREGAREETRRQNADDARADATRKAREEYRAGQDEKLADRRQNVADAKEAERVREARTQFRSERGAGIVKERRDAFRAEQIKSERDVYRAAQARQIDRRTANAAEARTRALRDAYAADPRRSPNAWGYGKTVSNCHGWGLSVGFGLGLSWCNPYGWYWSTQCWPSWYWNNWNQCNSYWYWWGLGGYSYSWFCHPFSWSYAWNYGSWPSYRAWWPSAWVTSAYAPPVYYASTFDDTADVIIYDYDGTSDIQVYGGRVEVHQGVPAAVGEGVQSGTAAGSGSAVGVDPTVAGVLGSGPDTALRMVQDYLASGDAAFREGRFGDAAHYYAKAIELRPEEGVLYLVLSDALFATGDYHYGAFALRRAFEFDPALASSDIDKREFYADPAEFERQLQLLERYLADRPTDVDARLLLAANYLFSRRPQLAVDLLESGSSTPARNESAGQRILEAAKAALAKKP